MKVECNYCNNYAYGNIPELIEKGWNRAIFRKPIRKTFTACPSCIEKLKEDLDSIINKHKAVRGKINLLCVEV